MEAWYGDYSRYDDDIPSDFADVPVEPAARLAEAPAGKASLRAAQPHEIKDAIALAMSPDFVAAPAIDDIVLSTKLAQTNQHSTYVMPTVARQISIFTVAIGLVVLTLHFNGALAALVAGLVLVAPTAFHLACSPKEQSWRKERRTLTTHTPDDAAMWQLLLAVGKGLGFVKNRVDDLIKLSSSLPDDIASSEVVNTVTRDLRGLVTAFQAAYEFADHDQRETLTKDLVRSVENVGSYAGRQHELLMRSRLDAFHTHRRFIDSKTTDDNGLLAA